MGEPGEDDELAALRAIAREAGALALTFFEMQSLAIAQKQDGTIVTQADKDANALITQQLHARFPDIPVLSEEDASTHSLSNTKTFFLVDPIDGTYAFSKGKAGKGEFTTMIALVSDGKPVKAVVHQPTTGTTWFASKGRGAFVKKGSTHTRLQVSNRLLSEAIFMMSPRYKPIDGEQRAKERLGVASVLRSSSFGIKAMRVAEGIGDCYLTTNPRTGFWDVAPCQIIVIEAGGKVTDLDGKEIVYKGTQPFLKHGVTCTNTRVHDALLKNYHQHPAIQ